MIDDEDDAKGALDRITIPEDELDRIALTALPRSSFRTNRVKQADPHRDCRGAEQSAPGGFITCKPAA